MATVPNRDTVDETARDFTVVLIPCDDIAPVQEVTVHQPAGEALGCMLKFASRAFSAKKLDAAQLSAYSEQVRASSKDALSDDVIAKAAQLDLCEVIPLCPNHSAFDFVNVNMVVDDKGVSKELRLNTRATAVVQSCGLATQVRGDAFVARQFDNEKGFYRLDFKLADLASDAPWMQRVRLARRGGAPLKDLCTLEKEKGNAAFKQKRWDQALSHYEAALTQLGGAGPDVKAALLSNAAACLLAMDKPSEALARANDAVEAKGDWFKAHGRVGDALVALKRAAEAVEAYTKALKLHPDSPDIQARLDAALKMA